MDIKQLVTRFPKIERILNEYNIICRICSRRECHLKEVIELHNLNEEEKGVFLNKIIEVIYPDKLTIIPNRNYKVEKSRDLNYSLPMKILVDEHNLINEWLDLIPLVIKLLNKEIKVCMGISIEIFNFFHFYIDKFHFTKEEELFGIINQDLRIIKTLNDEHDEARFYSKIIELAIEEEDVKAIKENLNIYKTILKEHMEKEEQIFLPWMDSNLSITQKEGIYSNFCLIEENPNIILTNCKKLIDEIRDTASDMSRD